jgi:6-methylsalicylate decarboxylase
MRRRRRAADLGRHTIRSAHLKEAAMPRYDVHAHFAFDTGGDPRRVRLMRRQWENFKGPPPVDGNWSPSAAVAFMDERGIDLQLLSLPVAADAGTARAANDQQAAIVAVRPDRFGMLAALPMADPDQALVEVRRAADELGADGFILVSNYGGRYLGDPGFEPVLAELGRRRATVFLHPINPPCAVELSLGRPGPVIEFPMDTARTVLDGLFAGVFLRHPGIRMVLSHGGGALPALSARILALSTKSWTANPRRVTGQQLRDQMASLYFDTAIAGDPVSLRSAVDLGGRNHLVFGTDFPPAGTDVIDSATAALADGATLSAGDLERLDTTFRELFPRAVARAQR